jgi:hypothetical protein
MAGAPQSRASTVARWAIAVPASVAVHVLVALALLRGGVDPSRIADAAERSTPLEIPIKLGIEKSDTVTPNWLGFEIPTPHVAAPSRVNQSELTRAQGDERDNLARAFAAQVQAATTQTLSEARAVLEAFRAELARAQAQAAKQAEPEPTPAAETPPQPTPQPTPEPKPAEDDEQDGSPGQKDTRAADAVSLPTDVRRSQLGNVVAGKGLKINTTRPHLTDLQQFLGRPPSPLVEIFFDHTGRVFRARIPDGRGSGRSDIDQALVNAIYEWTAEGEQINALEEGDPPLLVRMRIMF